jgi:hypothetical protein
MAICDEAANVAWISNAGNGARRHRPLRTMT